MKILYGVVGVGMGHATRSQVILDHLVRRHEVEIVVSGHAQDYLKRRFPNVVEIEGLRMSFENNRVDRSQTFWDLVKRLPQMLSANFDRFVEMSQRFSPDVVISDFESFAHMFARHHDLPVISVDNMQIINRCELDLDLDDEQRADFRVAKGIVKGKLPGCYHYLITTFFFPPLRKERTSLYPPILRDQILDAETRTGDHLLVYQTTTPNDQLLGVLEQAGIPARVYGLGGPDARGSIDLRPFSEDGFVEDLATCRGVLATGGFSLMGEAIYLGKPVLAVPLKRQFEQLLNALYLQKLGYGEYHSTLTAEAVRGFCDRIGGYTEALGGHQQQRNEAILSALDRLLAEIDASRRAD